MKSKYPEIKFDKNIVKNLYGDAVYIDTLNGAAGTVVGANGTKGNPCSLIADAHTLATALGLRKYVIRNTSGAPLLLEAPYSNWTFEAEHLDMTAIIDLNSQLAVGALTFRNLAIIGIATAGAEYDTCALYDVTGFSGVAKNSIIKKVSAPVSGSIFLSCWSWPGSGTIDFVLSDAPHLYIVFNDFKGSLSIDNLEAGDTTDFNTAVGLLTLQGTCTGGVVTRTGVSRLVDASGGAVTINSAMTDGSDFTNIPEYGDAIWVDPLNGTSGQIPGINGTKRNPVDNDDDATALASALNLQKMRMIHTNGTYTLLNTRAHCSIIGEGDPHYTIININSQNDEGLIIENATVTGNCVAENWTLKDCQFAATNFMGTAKNCELSTFSTNASGATLENCFSIGSGAVYDCVLSDLGKDDKVINFSGKLTVINMEAGDALHFNSNNGELVIDSSCTGGTIYRSGVHKLTDNSHGQITYNDWFLPSFGELDDIWTNLYSYELGNLSGKYWTSKESDGQGGGATAYAQWYEMVKGSDNGNDLKSVSHHVRPVRYFESVQSYELGDTGPAGGLIFRVDNGKYWECGLVDLTDSAWSNVIDAAVPTVTDNGITNTPAIVAQVGHTASAAKECVDYISDWILPMSAITYDITGLTNGADLTAIPNMAKDTNLLKCALSYTDAVYLDAGGEQTIAELIAGAYAEAVNVWINLAHMTKNGTIKFYCRFPTSYVMFKSFDFVVASDPKLWSLDLNMILSSDFKITYTEGSDETTDRHIENMLMYKTSGI